MAQNQFKTRYIPNADGSESSTALTNSNCVFVHTYLGDDYTGDGTRQKPYRSMAKALLKGLTYVLFRGLINESFSTTKLIIGDDINQTLITSNYTMFHGSIVNLTIDYMKAGGFSMAPGSPCYRIICLISSIGAVISTSGGLNISFVKFLGTIDQNTSVAASGWVYSNVFCNSSVKQYLNVYKNSITNVLRNAGANTSAIYSYNVYMVTLKAYNYANSTLMTIVPNYTNDSVYNISLFRNALIFFGIPSDQALNMTWKDSFGNETCKIVKELRAGGTKANIFNRYDINRTGTLQAAITATAKSYIRLINTSVEANLWPTSGDIYLPTESDITENGITMTKGWDGTSVLSTGSSEIFSYTSVTINGPNDITLTGPSYTFKTAHNSITKKCTRYGQILDYSLNPDPTNEALWASETGGFVGPNRPAYDSIQSTMTSIVVVDEATGADTATAGDLIYLNSAGEFVFNNASTQTWNRFSDSVTKYIPQGSTFKGGGGDSVDGSPFGYYIGKKQNLIGTTKYYAGDTLTVGKWYKVYNDTAISVNNAIIYNSVQYLPEYTFCCVTGVTAFSLLNAGTGSYVMEILAGVIESIELMPVDMIAILTATLSGLAYTIPVTSTSGFPSSGSLYIGGKTFVYTSIDATNFYGLPQDVGTVASGKDVGLISAFPKFSVPINGECKLLYYTAAGATRYGKTAGNPVLFADLAVANMITDFGSISNKISYYDSWAISNADQEFFVLGDPTLTSPRSTYFTTAIPNIRYFRRSINAHFDKPYDY